MNIYLFTLFGACLLFAGFSMYLNLKTLTLTSRWIKIASLLFMFAGLTGAMVTLVVSLMRLFERLSG